MNELCFIHEDIVWQEVPNEVSLAFLMSGCPLHCRGCHSSHAWQPSRGKQLDEGYLQARLNQYRGLISCVLFLGGEWQAQQLRLLLRLVQEQGLKTCLYTGLERHQVDAALVAELTYLKTGPWQAERGGLDSAQTNQVFVEVATGNRLNHLFFGSAAAEQACSPIRLSNRQEQ